VFVFADHYVFNIFLARASVLQRARALRKKGPDFYVFKEQWNPRQRGQKEKNRDWDHGEYYRAQLWKTPGGARTSRGRQRRENDYMNNPESWQVLVFFFKN
jgi:hypothetical protein